MSLAKESVFEVLAWKSQHATGHDRKATTTTLASGKETDRRLYSPAAGVRLRLFNSSEACTGSIFLEASTLDMLKVCVNKELVLIHMLFPWGNCKHKIKDTWFIKGISLYIVTHFCVSQEHEDSGLRCCNSASLKNLPLLWKKLSAVDWLDQLLLSLILDIITDWFHLQ